METRTLRVFDFDKADNNHFLTVRELWIRGPLYRRRADIVGFVNGVPLLFMELKNIHRNVRRAYDENLADYQDTVAHIFHHNAFVVLGNGVDARVGSYSASFVWDFVARYGTREGDANYSSRHDLTQDGAVDFSDFLEFAEAFGKSV